jgi:hypothetical protein
MMHCQKNIKAYTYVWVVFYNYRARIAPSDSLRLEGPRIESQRGQDFSYPSQTALGSIQPLVKWLTGLLERPRLSVEHPIPPSSSAESRSRAVPLPHIWAFMVFCRRNFTFLTHWNPQPAVRRAEPSIPLLLILAFCR